MKNDLWKGETVQVHGKDIQEKDRKQENLENKMKL